MLDNLKAFLREQIEHSQAAKEGTTSDTGTVEQIWNNGYETGQITALELVLIALENPFYTVPASMPETTEKKTCADATQADVDALKAKLLNRQKAEMEPYELEIFSVEGLADPNDVSEWKYLESVSIEAYTVEEATTVARQLLHWKELDHEHIRWTVASKLDADINDGLPF